MLSIRRCIRLGSAGALLVIGVGIGAIVASPPAGASGFSWSVVPTPNPSSSPNNNLSGVACTSLSNCWAVGFASSGSGVTNQTLAEHWSGTAWSIVTTPNVISSGGDVLGSVACVSSSDCWAVGSYTPQGLPVEDTQALAEHWNGTAWSIVTTPIPNPLDSMGLFGVACVSSSDCWAVGFGFIGGGGTRGPLAEHWNGSAWSIIATDNPSFVNNQLSGVTCISTSDCWAVGFALTGNFDQTSQTFADHWNGSAWSIVTTPNTSSLQTNQLGGVSCVSSSDCWAVGLGDVIAGVEQTLAEHWNGTAWSIVTTPLGQRIFSGVTCVTRSDCWAVGAGASGIEHWHHTAWSIVATPNASLSSVACATRSDCWAVGFATNGTVNQTVAEHGTRHHHPNRGH